MIRDIQEIQALATKYSKQQLAQMAQMGMLDPTKAVMAGMMIKRIEDQNQKPPQTTVAQDVLGVPQPQQQPQQPPQQAPQPQMAQAPMGMESLPAGDVGNYAGGGIVAFGDGGDVPGYADRGYVDSRNDPAMRIDPREQKRRDMQWRLPILLQELKEAQAAGRPQDIVAIQREIRALKPAPTASGGIYDVIPAAQAADVAPSGLQQLPKLDTGNKKSVVENKTPAGSGQPLDDYEYYGLPFGGRSGSEAYYERPVMPYGEQMRNVGSSIVKGVKNLLSIPETEVTPTSKAKAPPPPTEDQSAAETARLQRQANSFNPFAAQNDQPSAQLPGQRLAQEEGAVTPPVAALPALTAPSTAIDVKKFDPGAARDLGKISKERLDAYKEQGIDPELYNKMIADERTKQGKLEGRKDEAKGQALMQFGLGLLGARRGQEFEVAAKSGQSALSGYQQAAKDLRAEEEKFADRINSFKLADNQARMTGLDKDLATRDKEKERVMAAESKFIDAQNAVNVEKAKLQTQQFGYQSAAETSRYVADQQAKTYRDYTAELKKQQYSEAQIKNITDTAQKILMEMQKNPKNFKVDPAELQQQALDAATQLHAGAVNALDGKAPPLRAGKTIDFGSIK